MSMTTIDTKNIWKRLNSILFLLYIGSLFWHLIIFSNMNNLLLWGVNELLCRKSSWLFNLHLDFVKFKLTSINIFLCSFSWHLGISNSIWSMMNKIFDLIYKDSRNQLIKNYEDRRSIHLCSILLNHANFLTNLLSGYNFAWKYKYAIIRFVYQKKFAGKGSHFYLIKFKTIFSLSINSIKSIFFNKVEFS